MRHSALGLVFPHNYNENIFTAIEPLIGFTAGVFLYVGASDLLPEAHRRFNRSLVLATLAGAALIPSLGAALGL